MMRAQQSGARRLPHFLTGVHRRAQDRRLPAGAGQRRRHRLREVAAPIVVCFFLNAITEHYGEAEDRMGRVTRQIVEYFDRDGRLPGPDRIVARSGLADRPRRRASGWDQRRDGRHDQAATLSAMRRAVLALLLTASPIALAAQPPPSRSGRARSTTRRFRPCSRSSATPRATEITSPEQVATYLRALGQAAPDRTRLIEYARTWEGRPLWLFVVGSAERIGAARPGEGRHQAAGRPARAGGRRRRPARRRRCRWWCGWCTACTATRSARAMRRCSRPITCWPPAATPASTRCCATRWCSSTRCRTPTAAPASCSRTCRAAPPRPTRRPTTPSTTSRGRAAARTTTCST